MAIHEEVAKEISKSKIKKVGVLGTKVTVGNNFYKKALDKYHIEYVGLDEKDEDKLSDIIFNEILPGKERKDMPKIILEYVKKVKDKGCDAVVLACTEMPLFISQKDTNIKLLSSTDILAKSTVKKIFE